MIISPNNNMYSNSFYTRAFESKLRRESMRVSIKFTVKESASIRARLIARIFLHLILRPSLSAARRESDDRNRLTIVRFVVNSMARLTLPWLVNESASGNARVSRRKKIAPHKSHRAGANYAPLDYYFFDVN